MDINLIPGIAREMMTDHGVGYMSFGFADAIGPTGRAAGQTRYKGTPFIAYKIEVSLPWARYLPEFKVREIILHEIAHAKTPHGTGHGPAWQDYCIKYGIPADPKFKYPSSPWDE